MDSFDLKFSSNYKLKLQVHIGVYGFVSSTIGHRIPHAEIVVEGIKHTVRSAQEGDYWRLLLPGKYNITFAARGYETYTSEIVSFKLVWGFHKLLYTLRLYLSLVV